MFLLQHPAREIRRKRRDAVIAAYRPHLESSVVVVVVVDVFTGDRSSGRVSRRPPPPSRRNIRQDRLVRLPAGQQSAVGAVRYRHHVLQAQVGHVVRQPGRPGAGHQQHTQPVRRGQAGLLGRAGTHMEGVRGLPQAGRKGRYNGVMFTMTLRRSRRSLSFSRIIFALVLNTRSCRGSRNDVGKYVFGFVTSVCANRNADCLKTKNRFCDIGGGGEGVVSQCYAAQLIVFSAASLSVRI